MRKTSWQSSVFSSDSKILNNVVQKLSVESKRTCGTYLSTVLRHSDLSKGSNFCLPETFCLRYCLAGHLQDLILLCLGAEEPWRLLEMFLNRQLMLVRMNSEFGENGNKMVLADLDSHSRTSGEEYVHLLESLWNLPNVLHHADYCCTSYSLKWSLSANCQIFICWEWYLCFNEAILNQWSCIEAMGILKFFSKHCKPGCPKSLMSSSVESDITHCFQYYSSL